MALNHAIIAQRYATALFELSHDQNSDTETLAELQELTKVLQSNPNLVKVINAKNINESTKKEVLKTLTESASQLVTNLINMTFDYQRFDLLPQIVQEYQILVHHSVGHMTAEVKTVVELDANQIDRLKQVIVKRFGAKTVELKQIIDPSLLGGVIISANNQIVDGSLATKLAAIRQSIVH
ncbi:F0F1 ATP synthase subunit delta [Weissella coleopterorum]|uniref:ATP synthase subunit delta n=1 Tax=Weissella coleopterorum TaxID=2714949 RepID=A0A6G8AZ98_9LACO|nr:ATP synthase F1 subunit delta [Weissella coleopterorum]QIL50203.1 F0F1 ATP synthase subunit delta [Weissella coleopterorum]